jgi:hypothetical protein
VPLTSDSFYSPRYNVVVFSSRRLDLAYEGVARSTEGYWNDFKRDAVLHKETAKVPKGHTTGDLWLAETYSLMLRAMEEEGELAAVSHSGTRQLLVGSGLLPHNVIVPHWLQSGMGSFMQTPYGSPWRGYGAPNWSYLLSFHELKKDKKLPAAADLLRDVLADRYFREGDRKHPSVKARATAWALTYYLMQNKNRLPGLQNYFKELSRLPRDLELEGDAVLDCFARAMDCHDGSGKRNEQKLNDFAEAWMNFMDGVKLDNDAAEILQAIHKLQNELALEQNPPDKAK